MMMMESGHHSLSIPVPNIIASSPSGGRFDFDDGGVYCGGWQDGKAHGHGVCTGPKNVGEYSGSWNFGFEMSGVYKWKNGAVYEGRWQNGKRHGVGVEYNGKWIYKGEWSQGFKGRYGVKASSNSAVKYEGTWANGLQDGYGSETYSDGGYYQGQMCRGLRHGYGVRKSAPYGDSRLNNPAGVRGNSNNNNGPTATSVGGSSNQQQLGVSGSAAMIHSNSLQSQSSMEANSDDDSPKLEDGFKPNIERTLASKNGFVLVAKPLDVSLPKHYPSNLFHSDNSSYLNLGAASGNNKPSGASAAAAAASRRNSLTNRLASAASRIPGNNNNSSSSSSSQNSSSIFSRGLRRLKKQKSTSDLADSHLMMPFSVGGIQHRQQANNKDHHSAAAAAAAAEQLVPFALSPEELDITDPTTVETYTGEWKQDKRNGHGLCERSDGLKYEGQWHNDMKCGYGVTTFKDGSKEEGKYKNNILIADSKVKRFLHFGSSNMRQRIDDAVKMAHQAQTMALKKAEIADTRAATARDKADQATTAALEADRDSQIAFSVARQYSDSQQQLGMAAASAAAANFQPQLAMAMQDYPTMFAPHLQQHHMGAFPQSANQNALQMRRQSQQQQQQQFNRSQQQFDASQQQQQDQMDHHQQMDAQQQQQQQGKQFLGALEPFNGRRGSFRGGANVNLFAMNPPGAAVGGGGSRTSPFGASSSSQASAGGREPSGGALSAPNPGGRQATSHSDPFSDLFDHYKSSASSVSEAILPAGLRARNRMLSKQTSLDIANARLHRTGATNISSRSLQRMSSMDHAEENQQQRQQQQQQQFQGADERLNPMEQQLKHLVTSGEELQRQQQSEKGAGSAGTDSAADRIVTTLAGSGQTPSGGSSAYGGLPPSASAASTQNSSSAFYGHNQTATPSPDLQSNAGAGRPSGQQRYLSGLANHSRGQQSSQAFAAQIPAQYHHQFHHQQQQLSNSSQADRRARDVHSLADDQLYMAGSRRRDATTEFGGDRSDFTNYDFVISSAPRMTRKVMRRTASLSRNTPIRSISETRAHNSHQQLDSSMANLRQRSISPAAGSHSLALSRDHQSHVNLPSAANHDNHHNHNFNQPPMAGGVSAITITEPATQPAANLNHVGACDDASAPSPTGHFTLDSSYTGSSSGSTTAAAHLRKPSLQVRYDPNDLGGLMTREEVAALSHAQREQKRLEAELAESRAKRPLLHLYLTIKEFLIHRKLILSVLMINICLFEMFANLIV